MSKACPPFQFKEIVTIWTGDADGNNTNEGTNAYLRETGILGSIRWWYEAVVRGYGGYACDPTSDTRCPDENGNRCAVCEFFGCTDWSAKFRFKIEKQNNTITMNFIPIKEIKEEEKYLLIKTLYIISKYGSIGGKTIFKPPKRNEKNKNKPYHKDYGLILPVNNNDQLKLLLLNREQIENYVKAFKVFDNNRIERQNNKEFPNLQFFIFKKGEYLDQNKMNELLGIYNVIGNLPERVKIPGSLEEKLRNCRDKTKKKFLESLINKIYYKEFSSCLTFMGVMSEDEKNVLISLSSDTDYQNLINNLYNISQSGSKYKDIRDWLRGYKGKSKFLFSFWTPGAQRWWCYSKADETEYQNLKALLEENELNADLTEGRSLL